METYIKMYRKILEWEWWPDINTHRLFSYMLVKANWTDGKFRGVPVPRGSFVSSISGLSDATFLTVDEVRTALKHLKSTNDITSRSYSKFTVFTVKNYDLYQGVPEQIPDQAPSKSQTDTEQAPSRSHSIPILFPTIEEYKELKEGEEGKKGSNKEKNREKKKVDNSELLERLLPDYPVSEVLSDKIREWIAYKKAKKDTYVEQGMRSLLKKIAEKAQKYGDFTVIDLIDTCMANNWKGIIWDKLETANSRQNGAGASRNAQFDQLMEQIRKDEENADRRGQKDCSGAYGDVSRL